MAKKKSLAQIVNDLVDLLIAATHHPDFAKIAKQPTTEGLVVLAAYSGYPVGRAYIRGDVMQCEALDHDLREYFRDNKVLIVNGWSMSLTKSGLAFDKE